MNVLLDTNVLSEVRRPAPDPRVLAWLDAIDEDRTYISVASIAELKRGIALMDDGRRRTALSDWLAQDLPERFAGRILPIDPAIAGRWGDLMAEARMSGLSLSVMDGFFAATALDRNLVLATRNTKDSAPLGVSLFNPWTDGGQSR
ncbi:type II toxin-antitoxin system VapC family toxin [Xanthobacter sp. AM11]|uniref:type II toxin-antitoxin system VapC family toxin n=1 Tax=Xanthobacter sp. AM11 TaxID=3380643 RepID=UPI0039BFE437